MLALVSLSYSVLLAYAEGGIVPLDDDWRCHLLRVEETSPAASVLAATTGSIFDEPSDRGGTEATQQKAAPADEAQLALRKEADVPLAR